MRKVTTAVLLLSLVGCSDQMDEKYSTYADAQRAGAIERGWVPAFVPASARDITDSHNLDTNRQTLQLTIPPSQVETMVAGLRSVSAGDKRSAAELSREHGFRAAPEAYVVCSEPLNGALAVDRESGRAVYDTTVAWADDDCPNSLDATGLPVWVTALIGKQPPRSRTEIEESIYQGHRAFLVMPADRAPDSGNEHVLYSEDGHIICEFGGFAGHVTVGSCDIEGIKFVQMLFPEGKQ